MRLHPSDPEIQVLLLKMDQGRLDLQPDFQRGEVWTNQKKKRLIDTILRDWHVPPIHVVVGDEDGPEEVLDGQQRLAAIRDFHQGKFSVDGRFEPSEPELEEVHGKRFAQLPPKMQRRFENFTIRYFKIVDYAPEEPGELFFRLNQPTNLTPAEKRNSFFGPVRAQIKDLVKHMSSLGVDRDVLGFTNSRMAYEDVLSRVCYTLENGDLDEKVTAYRVEQRFRSEDGFTESIVAKLHEALMIFGRMSGARYEMVRFNKATFYTWLLFLCRLEIEDGAHTDALVEFISAFETMRLRDRRGGLDEVGIGRLDLVGPGEDRIFIRALLAVFNDRAGSRVADTTSVLLRDAIVWLIFRETMGEDSEEIVGEFLGRRLSELVVASRAIQSSFSPGDLDFELEELLLGVLSDLEWGKLR